jgi:hypothetical protein
VIIGLSLALYIVNARRQARAFTVTAARSRAAWALWLALAACSERAPLPTLDSISPPVASTLVDTPMTLGGSGFVAAPHVALGSRKLAHLDEVWRVRVGPFESTELDRVDAETLRFTLPRGLSAGPYDVQLFSPLGAALTLSGQLRVAPGPVGLTLHLETSADGTGEEVGARTLVPGEALPLYAVFRGHDGSFVTGDEAVTFREQPLLGALSDSMASSTLYTARLPGHSQLTAAADGGETATVALHVSSDVAMGGDYHLRIEDEAGGGGAPIDAARVRRAGESLDCHAVLRDEDDQFVTDAVASWEVEGAGAAPSASSAQLSLSLRRAGKVRVTARYSDLAATLAVNVSAGRAAQLSVEPAGVSLHVGSAPLMFTALGRDVFGNATTDLGALTWSLADGAFASFDAQTARLTPSRPGTGHIAVASAYGPSATASIEVLPGPAVQLEITGLTKNVLHAGDTATPLLVVAHDADGNVTTDTGRLTWSIDGTFGDIDAKTGRLEPRLAGSGSVHVMSSYGVSAQTSAITVISGAIAELEVVPDTLGLTTDDAPLQLTASGRDAFGNPTNDVGTLTWSVASGSLTQLDPSGKLDPKHIGSGTVSVTSSYGLRAQSGTITITGGHATALTVSPNTWNGAVGDDAITFIATGVDSKGNATSDVGALTWSVASGPIARLDPDTGVFSPRVAGDGQLAVTSAYGASAHSQTVHVAAYTPLVNITALRASDTLWATERAARFEIDIKNDDLREVVVPSLQLSFSYGGYDVSSDYAAWPDRSNIEHILPGTTRTLVYYVDVSAAASPRAGLVNVAASADVFLPSGYDFTRSAVSTSAQWSGTMIGGTVTLTAPVVPYDRLCAGALAAFSCSTARTFVPSYSWRFAGGTPASSSVQSPSVRYDSIGAFSDNITLTDGFGLHDSEFGPLIFVGDVQGSPDGTYPTGPIVFSAPAANQSVSLSSLPRMDLIALSSTIPLKQCDGTPVAPTGHNALTAYSQRDLIDHAADIDPARAGVQIPLNAAGGVSNVPLRAPASRFESTTSLYFEYADPTTDVVTAAGNTTFNLTGDTEPPQLEASIPMTDCVTSCLGKGDPVVFRFNEPMAANSFNGIKLERLKTDACASDVNSTMSGSSWRYDAGARALYVTPQSIGGASYTVRVTLPASITDAAAAHNHLTQLVRCVKIANMSAAPAAATPRQVALSRPLFSPDGDQTDDTTSWSARADANTAWLQLQISRGSTQVWSAIMPVSGAATYDIPWTGETSTGPAADSGVYRYDLYAYNRAGVASSSASGVVELQRAVHLLSVRRAY